MHNIEDLAQRMPLHSSERAYGVLRAQPILICAEAGTGKTFCSLQLAHLLAAEMLISQSLALVPLHVPLQKVARVARDGAANGNLLHAYIEHEYKDDPACRNMLHMAYELRVLVLVLDGIDEVSALRDRIEMLIWDVLVPWRGLLLVTSRPEVRSMLSTTTLTNRNATGCRQIAGNLVAVSI